jgi:hypothetical protein
MASTLKGFFSPALVRRLAADLARVHPAFREQSFVKRASSGLAGLELLDRGRHIARVLAEHLPAAYPDAVAVLLRSLGPEHASDELLGAGMAPFYYYPHVVFVAERGLDHFDLSMQAQYELTKRFSAESSIRPYLAPPGGCGRPLREGPWDQREGVQAGAARASPTGVRGAAGELLIGGPHHAGAATRPPRGGRVAERGGAAGRLVPGNRSAEALEVRPEVTVDAVSSPPHAPTDRVRCWLARGRSVRIRHSR